MVDKTQGAASEGEDSAAPAPAATPATPRRAGHRGMDPRETIAELTAKAHEISQYAGTKVGAAMKDVIGAAAGLTGFAVESARDLIQYMVRRGQMTQIEGDKLLREVEAAHGARKPAARADEPGRAATQRPATAPQAKPTPKAAPAPGASAGVPKSKSAKEAKPAKKTAAPAAAKAERKADDKPAARKAKSADKPAAHRESDKPPAKSTTPAAEKGGKKAAEKSSTPKAGPTKSAAKGAAKKAAPKGSASRTETAPRPKAASKSAPVRKKK